MLVLSRKHNEAIVIGGVAGFEQLLKITVLRVSDGKVKFGIEAPHNVPVHRMEIWERIRDGVPLEESTARRVRIGSPRVRVTQSVA
jgi:carbon storage regulator